MKEKKLFLLVLASAFAALSAALAGFLPIPNATGGYIHIADAIVYLCASLLPMPYAASSSAVGFALADILSGHPYYALPSAIIRLIIVLFFTAKEKKIITKRNIIALPVSLIITVSGYFVFKFILYYFIQKMPEVALTNTITSIPGNIVQCLAGSVIYILIGTALDKMNFKEKLFGGK